VEPCPVCGSREVSRLRCPECPLTKLEEALEGPMGALLNRAQIIDAALKAGFHVGLESVTPQEFNAVLVLRAEQEKYWEEVTKDGAANADRPRR